MRHRTWMVSSLLAFLLIVSAVSPAFANNKEDRERWEMEMARAVEREQAALATIAQLEQEIAQLEATKAELEQRKAGIWQSIYDMLGIMESDVNDMTEALNGLQQDINSLVSLNDNQLRARQDEILEQVEGLLTQVNDMQNDPEAQMTVNFERLERLEDQLTALQSRVENLPPINRSYTVMRGDCLWRIAGMSRHYNDPMKWMRIYSFNSQQIQDPNLIYPNQVFTIPMEISRSQYLVRSGDDLYNIAQNLFRDPFQWRRLYEANQSFIGEDPNVIYPEMILTIPGR